MIGLGVACACIAVPPPGTAQQTVPFGNGAPIAPAGFEPQPIPAEPIEYDTAEVMRIRIVPVARGLVNPWSLAFLPDGTMLVTEKEGRLRIIRHDVLDPTPIRGVPAVRVSVNASSGRWCRSLKMARSRALSASTAAFTAAMVAGFS